MNNVPIGPFAGMNNRLPADQLLVREGRSEVHLVRSAVNTDFTNSGTLSRREGSERQITGLDCHSFWVSNEVGFFVDSDKLYRITQVAGNLTKTEIATVTPGLQFSYADTGTDVFASNGAQFFRISRVGAVVPAGLPLPSRAPKLTAQGGGSLPAGTYRVVISHSTDEESGTSYPVSVEVPVNSVIVVEDIEQIDGQTTTLYMTPPNGDTFYKVSEPTGTSLVISTLVADGPRPSALLMAPMPAGSIVRYLNGQLFVASGQFLYYSEPYYLTVHNPGKNYIWFTEPVTMVEPCQNGLYVSADQTYWIAGDITKAELNPVLPYKAITGTSSAVPNANSVWWMSERGTVLGTQNGEVQNLQEKNVAVDPAIVGASLYREQNGMKQMISALFGPQTTVMAAQSFMEAEVIRKETIL